jgi:hypothetical protein
LLGRRQRPDAEEFGTNADGIIVSRLEVTVNEHKSNAARIITPLA